MERVTADLCARVRGLISLDLDDELSELERSILESHTEDCVACREFRASVASYTDALRAAPAEAVGRSFRLPGRRSRLAPFSTTAAAAAAAVVVAGFATVLAPASGDPVRGPSLTAPTPAQPPPDGQGGNRMPERGGAPTVAIGTRAL
jgi:anti-sigma factor RsiW